MYCNMFYFLKSYVYVIAYNRGIYQKGSIFHIDVILVEIIRPIVWGFQELTGHSLIVTYRFHSGRSFGVWLPLTFVFLVKVMNVRTYSGTLPSTYLEKEAGGWDAGLRWSLRRDALFIGSCQRSALQTRPRLIYGSRGSNGSSGQIGDRQTFVVASKRALSRFAALVVHSGLLLIRKHLKVFEESNNV